MEVLNSQMYRISEHAFERLDEIFNIPRGKAYKWLRRLLKNVEFIKKDPNSCERYRYKEIVIVLSPINHIVVTVFHVEINDALYPNLINTRSNKNEKTNFQKSRRSFT